MADLIPHNTDIGMAKFIVNDVPEGPIGVALHDIARGMGVNVSQLEMIVVAIPKPHGDALQKLLQHRLFGFRKPRQVGGNSR